MIFLCRSDYLSGRRAVFTSGEGFTLVELVIVMLIISLGMSLVGGFSISSYSKFQVTAETKQLVRQIQYLKRKAYLTESPYSLNFSDNRLQVTSKNETQRIIVFSHLHFEQQSVKISRFGRSDSTKVSFIANDQNKHLSF